MATPSTSGTNRTGRSACLSLCGCACLALAEHRRHPVITADRLWSELDVAIEVRTLR